MISILMPAFNSGKYIAEAITSVIAQDFKDWELIIVNDGSTDDTVAIANSFDDDRIHIFNIEHSGNAIARKEAFSHAKGDFIAFLDADDVMHPQLLETLYEACLSTGSDVSVCKYWRLTNDQVIVNRYASKAQIKIYDERRMVLLFTLHVRQSLWNKLFRRRCFDNLDFPTFNPCSDMPICYHLLANANKIAFIDRKLIWYRIHEDSITGERRAHAKRYADMRLRLWAEMLEWLWDEFPKSRPDYRYAAKTQLELAKQDGTIDDVDTNIIARLRAISIRKR